MKTIYTFFLFTICSLSMIHAQEITEFSDLSSTPIGLFNSVSTDNGIVYFINNGYQNRVVQVGFDGEITKETNLPFEEDSIYYNGYLHHGTDHLYLIGHSRLLSNGTNSQDVWNSQRRSVVEFDDNLEVAAIHLFPTVPFGGGELVGTSGTFVGTYNPVSVGQIDDQLVSVWPYLIFDTNDNISIIGSLNQLDVIDLDNDEIDSYLLENVTLNLDAVFLDDDFLVYGETADTVVNGTAFNTKPIARYSYTGELLETHFLDNVASGAFSDGVTGQKEGDLIYSSYYGKNLDLEGCSTNSAVIDVRNLDFELINRVKLPDCDRFPYSNKPFAFANDQSIYYVAIGSGGINSIYKYSPDLQLEWNQSFVLPDEQPVSIKARPDGGMILECLYAGADGFQIKLYAFDANGMTVSQNNIDINDQSAFRYGPNPATEWIYPLQIAEANTNPILHVYSMTGQLIFSQSNLVDGVDISQLSAGPYLLQTRDAKSDQILGIQTFIKQ